MSDHPTPVALHNLGSNFHRLAFENGLSVWFSYETPVAFAVLGTRVVRQNSWGPTTGKHLNQIDGGDAQAKAARVTGDMFNRILTGALTDMHAEA